MAEDTGQFNGAVCGVTILGIVLSKLLGIGCWAPGGRRMETETEIVLVCLIDSAEAWHRNQGSQQTCAVLPDYF